MRHIWLLLIALALGHPVSAQFNEKPILNLQNEDLARFNWGYFLGFNQYDFKFEYKETEDGPEVYVHNRYIGGYADLIKEIENTIGGYGDSGF